MQGPDFLETSAGRRLAYHRRPASGEGQERPGLVFLGGFKSDMAGTKATWLDAWTAERGRGFLRFDYSGHGQSSGAFEDGSIGDWADDAAEMIEMRTEGPQILVGSSMGGWIACLVAKRLPERIAGMVGIAAAPDFTEDSMWEDFTIEQKIELNREGYVVLPSDYDEQGCVVTRRLIEDGRHNLLLRTPLPLPFPVRLLHGSADADVPVERGVALLDHMDCPDARLLVVKDADHRFSDEAQLALIAAAIDEVSDAAR